MPTSWMPSVGQLYFGVLTIGICIYLDRFLEPPSGCFLFLSCIVCLIFLWRSLYLLVQFVHVLNLSLLFVLLSLLVERLLESHRIRFCLQIIFWIWSFFNYTICFWRWVILSYNSRIMSFIAPFPRSPPIRKRIFVSALSPRNPPF
jgi:hypothetical protein